MVPSQDFRLTETDEQTGRSVINHAGGQRCGPVDGVVLEIAFSAAPDRSVVVLSDDSPFDEGLHIYLLGADGQIIDGIHSNTLYSPGIFRHVATHGMSFEFSFFLIEHDYRLICRDRHFWRPLPRGWSYYGWKIGRYLSLETIPNRRDINV